jgi:predicted Fe-S protein YdhL (DUF1289 family)
VRRQDGDDSVVKSPCIDVCKMEAGVCAGCFRTIDEIARWGSIGDDEKRLILAAVAQRRGKLDPAPDLACNCQD